ncbi:hypothetical protein O9929_15670 [Vibrio lentus]|nr:hypothetical protein [Vibrio lentus]
MHTDGSWPGGQVVNEQLVDDAYGDRWSMCTFLILLVTTSLAAKLNLWLTMTTRVEACSSSRGIIKDNANVSQLERKRQRAVSHGTAPRPLYSRFCAMRLGQNTLFTGTIRRLPKRLD